MKFNYFKVAKEIGHSDLTFKFCKILKNEHGDRRYMAANWLAWAYTFQRTGQAQYARDNLKLFLYEIEMTCKK